MKPPAKCRTVSVAAVARAMDVDERTVRRMCLSREIGCAFRVSERGAWRIPVEYLEAFERELAQARAEIAETARRLARRRAERFSDRSDTR